MFAFLVTIYAKTYSQSIFIAWGLVPLIIVFELDVDEFTRAMYGYFITLYVDKRAGNIEDFRYVPVGDTTFGIDGEFIDP